MNMSKSKKAHYSHSGSKSVQHQAESRKNHKVKQKQVAAPMPIIRPRLGEKAGKAAKASAGKAARHGSSEIPTKPEAKVIIKVHYFENVPPDVIFKLADGTEIGGLLELSDALLRMPDDIFYYHVRPDANDFAKWVYDVFRDEKLAQVMSLCHTREETNHHLLRHLLEKALKD
jgi:hypothetical protein